MASGLSLTRKVGESIRIGEHVTISVIEISYGRWARLRIVAPGNVPIRRCELEGSHDHKRQDESAPTALLLTRSEDQSIQIGPDIVITVTNLCSNQVGLRIVAPASVKIMRTELGKETP